MAFGRFFNKFRRKKIEPKRIHAKAEPPKEKIEQKRAEEKEAEPAAQRMPEFVGEYRKIFLELPIKSTTFVKACQAKGLDPKKVFTEFFASFEGSIEAIWVSAREAFLRERQKILQSSATPKEKIAMERRTLERIFAAILKQKK